MAYNFIPCDREQSFLMPPSLCDWLPPDHLAWFVIDAVAQMGLSAFRAKYRADGWGAWAFSPDMMVALLLYAYCTGVRSSRKIEKLCETDVAFRIVAGNTKPDHATIARFRRKNLKELEGLFVQILRLCAEAGLVKVGVVALTDAGYYSEEAVAATSATGVEVLCATTKDHTQRKALKDAPPPRGRIPDDLSPMERMDRKLLTKRGRALYRLRSQTVEPVFGQIKGVRGIDRFLLRGLDGASGEWKLACGTHNLLKLWRSGRSAQN